MNATVSTNWCVATVTSATYAAGTQVLLTSFLRHNPWFAGTLAVIHGQQEPPSPILRGLPNVRWQPVSDELSSCLTETASAAVAQKRPRFHSLETFRLREFERVLYLDSDIVCTGDARSLFDGDAPLRCCPDQAHFWCLTRSRATYAPHDAAVATPDTHYPRTFNTGVMRVIPAHLDESTYAKLLHRVRARDWGAIRTGHSVSVVLNDHFSDTWVEAPERYNYLISPGMRRYRRPRAGVADAVFLHFLGRPKPWEARPPETIVNDDHRRALDAWTAAAAHCQGLPTLSEGTKSGPG